MTVHEFLVLKSSPGKDGVAYGEEHKRDNGK